MWTFLSVTVISTIYFIDYDEWPNDWNSKNFSLFYTIDDNKAAGLSASSERILIDKKVQEYLNTQSKDH